MPNDNLRDEVLLLVGELRGDVNGLKTAVAELREHVLSHHHSNGKRWQSALPLGGGTAGLGVAAFELVRLLAM